MYQLVLNKKISKLFPIYLYAKQGGANFDPMSIIE